MPEEEAYLGDGLYASFDGHHIKLRAPRYDGDHTVFLAVDVFQQLHLFALNCWVEAAREEAPDG
jgi:hypothetical protein